MLMTESQLRTIVRKFILSEAGGKQGLDNNEILASVEAELEKVPRGFISKIEKAVKEDIKTMDEEPLGDEAVVMMGAAAIASGPMILKGLKWIAKQMANGLESIGLNDQGEDVWWTGLPLDDHDCWYHKWHHFYQSNCEAFGSLILKLFGNEKPSNIQVTQAGNVVFLTCCIILGLFSFKGLLHALHGHELWSICGETILSCIEYGEVMMLLNTICAIAMGVDVMEHADEHGVDTGKIA